VKGHLKAWIGLIVSGVFIYFAFRRVEFSEIIHSVKNVNYIWIIPNVVIVVLTMVIRAERWRYILRPLSNFRIRHLFPAVMIGFMANNVLPVRLGEIVRAYSLGIKTGRSRSSIFATVVIERILDSLTLMAMFWSVILFIPFPPAVKKFGVATLILNLLFILVLILLRMRSGFLTDRISPRVPFLSQRLKERLAYILTKFNEGMSSFGRGGSVRYIVIWSLFLWVVTALSNYFIFMAFGYYPHVAASFVLLFFVAAAVLLPSAPGFIGVFQAAVIGAFGLLNNLNMIGISLSAENIQLAAMNIAALSQTPLVAPGPVCESLGLFGISKGEALSFSIVLWLCQYIPVTVLGLYYLKREHLSLKVSDS
jgi:uncharacterized protein (TIRG00374 family)